MRSTPVCLIAVALAACTTEPTAPVAVVLIAVDSMLLERGQSTQLTVRVEDAQGDSLQIAVSWTSSNSSVVSVSPTGAVTGTDTGTAVVRAAAGDHQDSVVVTVHAPVTTLMVAPDSLRLVPGSEYPMVAVAIDASGVTVTDVIRWRSVDPGVAIMRGDTVAATDAGTTLLIATAGTRGDTAVVTVAPATFTYIIAGDWALKHTCAISGSGDAYCWGVENSTGALGTGAEIFSLIAPVGVRGGLQFTTVTVGDGHTCGLSVSGQAYCWGYGANGRIGNPAAALHNTTPLAVAGDHEFVTLTTGYYHNCALTAAGEAWCWGNNVYGQAGSAAPGVLTSPTAVSTSTRFATISAARWHTCALGVDSLAYCWGYNSTGQLGDSTTTGRSTPAPVHGGLKFSAVSAGWTHACGLTMAGAAYCWGDDMFGALGNGDILGSSLVPVAVSGGLTFMTIEAGYYTTCGIASGGAAYCWGQNASGQLGTGDLTDASVPRPVGGGLTFESVAPGWDYACGITPAAIAYCWGSDVFGVLGNGAASGNQPLPVRVTGQP